VVKPSPKDLVRADKNIVFEDWEMVVYHCQQALEKLAKAIFFRLVDRDIPFSHNVENIVHRFENQLTESVDIEQYNFFSKLSRFYVGG
jgi:HEPN domain-containing protein